MNSDVDNDSEREPAHMMTYGQLSDMKTRKFSNLSPASRDWRKIYGYFKTTNHFLKSWFGL